MPKADKRSAAWWVQKKDRGCTEKLIRSYAVRESAKLFDLPPSDGAKGRLGIADLKEGNYVAEEAFG